MRAKLLSNQYPKFGGNLYDVTIGRFYDVALDVPTTGAAEVAHFTDDEGAHRCIAGGRALFDFDITERKEQVVQIPDATSYLETPVPARRKTDAVDHPSHYGGDTTYEAIKVIEAWGLNFNTGNAAKYISRAGKKSAEVVEDLKKAVWYLNREITNLEKAK